MNRFFSITVFLPLLSPLCWAGGNKEKDATQPARQQQDAQPQQTAPAPAASPFFTGNGGRGTSLAILAPKSTGLAENQNYLPALVQGEFVSNFSGFSAISVLDRVRLDEQYAELLSGYYSDDDEAGLDLGHLTSTDYLLTGNITRTATGYALQMHITKTADKMTTASYSGTFPFAELDNLTGIRRASLDLLQKMGVTPTERTRTELAGAAAANHVNAQTALAQGIVAQRSGNTVESLVRFYEANNYDSSFAEAATRVNALSATVRTGSIGQDIRNDIAWRREWIKLYEDAATWFKNNPPVFAEYIYDPQLRQGEVNYQNETVTFIWDHGSRALTIPSRKMLEDLASGLQATRRAEAWGLNPRAFELWDQNCVPTNEGFVRPRGGEEIKVGNSYWQRIYRVSAELLNDQGKVVATHHCSFSHNASQRINAPRNALVNTMKTGDRVANVTFDNGFTDYGEYDQTAHHFTVKADDITDVMTVRITNIYEFVQSISGGSGVLMGDYNGYYWVLVRSNPNLIPVRTGKVQSRLDNRGRPVIRRDSLGRWTWLADGETPPPAPQPQSPSRQRQY